MENSDGIPISILALRSTFPFFNSERNTEATFPEDLSFEDESFNRQIVALNGSLKMLILVWKRQEQKNFVTSSGAISKKPKNVRKTPLEV